MNDGMDKHNASIFAVVILLTSSECKRILYLQREQSLLPLSPGTEGQTLKNLDCFVNDLALMYNY